MEDFVVPIEEVWTMVADYISYLRLHNQTERVAEINNSVQLYK